MKWIGQYIVDLIARFRGDVYLEDIDTGTIASGGNLGLDSNNKIVKQADTGITDLHGAGVDGSRGQLLTDYGDGTITSEANLTFDGTLGIGAGSNTTQNALFIDADSLTTGSAIGIDVDDATTTANERDLLLIDFDKSGVTADGASVITTGLKIDIDDNATNHANSVQTYFGVESHVTWASTNGTNTGSCFYGNIGGGSASSVVTGLLLDVVDGGADIKIRSSADAGDYCTIATGAHGATTLTTVDDDATAAHFEIAADGDITLDSAGQIKLEPVAGNNILLDGTVAVDGGSVTGITTLGVDSVSLTKVQTSSESFVDDDISIMTSAAIDDRINTKYAYQYIMFFASDVIKSNWITFGQNGLTNHTWGTDTSDSGVTPDSSTMACTNVMQAAAFKIPFACKLIGFYGTGHRYHSNSSFAAGVFILDSPDYNSEASGSTVDTLNATLRAYAAAEDGGVSNPFNQKLNKVVDTGRSYDCPAGSMIFPAFKDTAGVNSGSFRGNMTVILATPIVTIA